MYTGKGKKKAAGKQAVCAVCTRCAQEICAGERAWYHNGTTVCADCFADFAREELRQFEYIPGEEMAE